VDTLPADCLQNLTEHGGSWLPADYERVKCCPCGAGAVVQISRFCGDVAGVGFVARGGAGSSAAYWSWALAAFPACSDERACSSSIARSAPSRGLVRVAAPDFLFGFRLRRRGRRKRYGAETA